MALNHLLEVCAPNLRQYTPHENKTKENLAAVAQFSVALRDLPEFKYGRDEMMLTTDHTQALGLDVYPRFIVAEYCLQRAALEKITKRKVKRNVWNLLELHVQHFLKMITRGYRKV